MRSIFPIILICLVSLNVFSQDSTLIQTSARKVYSSCVSGDFVTATSYFDQELLYRMDAGKLKQTWELIEGQVGKVKATGEAALYLEISDSLITVFQTCNFEKKPMDLKLVFNKSNKVAGFFFSPPSARFSYKAPSWVKAGTVKEMDIEISSADLRLKGKLTVPLQGTNFPVVILVHGSGPQDMDLSIGPNRVFKDIAIELAANGYAVIRYDKRTKAYQSEMAFMLSSMTPDDETVQDVLAAIHFAEGDEYVDATKIFILGHSFGGMMAPRIATLSKKLNGMILMAANARPLQILIMDQLRYLAKADSANPAMKESLDLMQEKVDRVSTKSYDETTDPMFLPMGIGYPYWKYVDEYDQFKEAIDVKIPMLILQGERDYQVTMEDFHIWQQKLAKRSDVTFHSFPMLNHLFMAGSGPSMPAEYEIRSNVAKEVADEISSWLKLQTGN